MLHGSFSTVCVTSLSQLGTCIGAQPYEQAAHSCHNMGARLCTSSELAVVPNDESSTPDGCNGDSEWVWTSTACVSTRYQLAHLKRTGLSRCFGTESELVTRCCGDQPPSEESDEPTGTSEASDTNSNASTSAATTVLLVALIIVLIAVILIVVLVTRSKSANLDNENVENMELRPKPFEIFMEAKQTANPLSDDEMDDMDYHAQNFQKVQMTNRCPPPDDDNMSAVSDELMQAWAAQRKVRDTAEAVWWIQPLPADVSVGAGSISRSNGPGSPRDLLDDNPLDLEWDEGSHEQPDSNRTYDNVDDADSLATDPPLGMGGVAVESRTYANDQNRGLSTAELEEQLESNIQARKQFFESFSTNESNVTT